MFAESPSYPLSFVYDYELRNNGDDTGLTHEVWERSKRWPLGGWVRVAAFMSYMDAKHYMNEKIEISSKRILDYQIQCSQAMREDA